VGLNFRREASGGAAGDGSPAATTEGAYRKALDGAELLDELTIGEEGQMQKRAISFDVFALRLAHQVVSIQAARFTALMVDATGLELEELAEDARGLAARCCAERDKLYLELERRGQMRRGEVPSGE